jgi:hypothetical protein
VALKKLRLFNIGTVPLVLGLATQESYQPQSRLVRPPGRA